MVKRRPEADGAPPVSVSGGGYAGGYPLRGAWTGLVPGAQRTGPPMSEGPADTKPRPAAAALSLCEERCSTNLSLRLTTCGTPRQPPSPASGRDGLGGVRVKSEVT